MSLCTTNLLSVFQLDILKNNDDLIATTCGPVNHSNETYSSYV